MKNQYLRATILGALAILTLLAFDTYADEVVEDQNPSGVNGSLNSNSGNSNSNNVTVEGDSITGTNTTVNQANTPSAIAPQLTAGYDTCSHSVTGAISGPGFGISGGKVNRDENCERLKLSKMLNGIGLKDAAVAILAQDKRVARAIRLTYPKLALKVIEGEEERQVKKN